jgi:uncharacterized protein (DUF488 family)
MGREFGRGIAELQEMAADRRVPVMCSQAYWWRCRRRVVADNLVVIGDDVRHIVSDGRTFGIA